MTGLDNPMLILEDVLTVSQRIARERDIEKQLHIIAAAARKITSAEAGSIYLLDNTHRYLLPTVTQGDVLEKGKNNWAPIELRTSNFSANVNAYCAITGQIINIADIYRYTGFDFSEYYDNDKITELKTSSILAVPLTDQAGLTVGVLTLLNRRVDEQGATENFPLEMENLVRGFAALAAISIANSRLLADNKKLLEKQEKMNASLIVENKELKGRLFKTLTLDQVIGRGEAMKQVFSLIEKIASSTATVFLNGETGTGKELIAATIHQNSPVKSGQFIAQNCAAFPSELLESEMFGYRKGAFSGATANKKGLFEVAHKGTLFLDEIGEMPLELQSKLLRALQEGEIRPVGGIETIKVDVRIIAATNRSLLDMVREGTFREDLYYRLNVFPIELPPLRERREDLPDLISYFVSKYAEQYNKEIISLDPQVMDMLNHYGFPGNVRELQNILERAVILAGTGNVLTKECLPIDMLKPVNGRGSEASGASRYQGLLRDRVAEFEAEMIKEVLNQSHGNQTVTAEKLGVSRRTLVEKLSRYNLRRSDIQHYN